MSTENDYVATAAAEKRLREVLDSRFGDPAFAARMADILLANSEIEYLPRKKSVSIRLKLPETASTPPRTPMLDKHGSSLPIADPEQRSTPSANEVTSEGEALSALVEGGQRAQAVEDAAVAGLGLGLGQDLPHDRGQVTNVAAPGTVVPFRPRTIELTDYDDGDADFFTE